MSQDTFPFAGTDQAAHFDEADAANKKKLAVVGGLVALAVGGAAFLLLGGGGGDGGDVFIPRAPRAASAGHAPSAVKKAAAKKLPVAYAAPIGRDPFQALYVVSAASTTSSTATNTAPTTVTPGGDTASVSATQAAPAPAPAPATTRYTLKLVSVSKPAAGEITYFTWLVDGKRTMVVPAQKFGKYGELVVLATEKNATGTTTTGAVIQVGDDTPIDVLIGQSVNVL